MYAGSRPRLDSRAYLPACGFQLHWSVFLASAAPRAWPRRWWPAIASFVVYNGPVPAWRTRCGRPPCRISAQHSVAWDCRLYGECAWAHAVLGQCWRTCRMHGILVPRPPHTLNSCPADGRLWSASVVEPGWQGRRRRAARRVWLALAWVSDDLVSSS